MEVFLSQREFQTTVQVTVHRMKKVYDSPNNIAIFIGIGLLNQNNKNIRFEPITRYNQLQMLVYEMMIMS